MVTTASQGRRRPKGTPWFVYPLALALVAGPAAWWGWKAWKANIAVQAAAASVPVETSICEQLLDKVSRDNPGKFYICPSSPTQIAKLQNGRRELVPLMANAVYELPLEEDLRVAGLTSGTMRYGWEGHYCTGLKPGFAEGAKPLDDSPVDERTC